MSRFLNIEIKLPGWVAAYIQDEKKRYLTAEERMGLAVELAARNVEEQSGGPIGAAIFERQSGKLVAPGVNIVVGQHCSLAHAEAVAIMICQKQFQTYDLSSSSFPELELAISCEPCIQCFGVIWWSGITSILTGASGTDLEKIVGFSEGPIPETWTELLATRPGLPAVSVAKNVLREESCAVLRRYRDTGGIVYNPGSSSG